MISLQVVVILFCIAREGMVSSASQSCILSIQLFIMSFFFLLDSWDGTLNCNIRMVQKQMIRRMHTSHHLERRQQEQVLQSANRCPCGSFWLSISIHASSRPIISFALASSFMSIWWIHGPYASRIVSTTFGPTRESCALTSIQLCQLLFRPIQ